MERKVINSLFTISNVGRTGRGDHRPTNSGIDFVGHGGINLVG